MDSSIGSGSPNGLNCAGLHYGSVERLVAALLLHGQSFARLAEWLVVAFWLERQLSLSGR
jgi:hypothetical protein